MNVYSDGSNLYAVDDLLAIASEQQATTELLSDLFQDPKIVGASVCSDSLGDVLEFVRYAMDSDESRPIIITPDGYLCDGAHRLVQAVLNNWSCIKVIRLDRMPECVRFRMGMTCISGRNTRI